jgi:dipeptidase E
VSGGNTLFAIQRWKEEGVDCLIREAAARGAVMTGGSAGAICWFDGGHSDSMDPETYREPMIAAAQALVVPVAHQTTTDEASVVTAGNAPKSWVYIRVSGLGMLPGLVCPHHDRTQSNGRPRYQDFDAMLQRHRGERAVTVDHWAALVVLDGRYHVFATPGKEGSCVRRGEDCSFVTDGSGVPAVWWKEVSADGASVVRHSVPPEGGLLEDLLKVADEIVVDPLEAICAAENPTKY